ncbi:MFS transporter [Gordonia sp. TBRC 11910]|uniref:MFS transporter n=1 Tax=Gordonia asplenii TaxID=2725283 RepID=A0A848KWE6_9ACTN|nr:MFS transporter [Gordonia asplenii]NMO03164.1 MFS transporter [Gordonia asplenii]
MNDIPTAVPVTIAADGVQEGARRLALIAVGALLALLSNAIVFVLPPLLPVIQAQYQLTTVSAATWIFTVLTLGSGAGFVLLPRVSDVIGDRSAAVIATGALTVGAVIPAIGNSYATLIIGAAILGFGCGSQMLPLGLLRRTLGEGGLSTAVAVLVVSTGVGIVAGMIGGGIIVQDLSIQDFFYILTAIFAVTTLACWVTIPRSTVSNARTPMGTLGTVWMVAWVATILLALTQGVIWGSAALIPAAIGIIAAIGWVVAQRRSATPVFDAELVRAPFVAAACIAIALFAVVNAAFLVLLSNYVQMDPSYLPAGESYGLGRTALQTGFLMVPFAVTFLVAGSIAEKPVVAGRGGTVLIAGALLAGAGLALLAVVHDQQWSYLVGAAVIGLGCAVGYTGCLAIVQLAVPEEKAGMAAAIGGVAMAVGFAVGSALVTLILSTSTVLLTGTDIAVAKEYLYGVAYWVAVGLALLIVVTVVVSQARNRRRTTAAV